MEPFTRRAPAPRGADIVQGAATCRSVPPMKSKNKQSSAVRGPRGARASHAEPRRGAGGCPIVGIGASAGGLEAFTQLLKHLPVDTGLAFVLVQHLDPQHESALTRLLARATTMPVREATQNLRVQANHVYIIPPNTNLGIKDGLLKLQARSRDRTALRSIDHFFEALARDQGQRAIGVILSGNATDGTLGLEAIKAEGGLTLAQDDSARFDSMPRSAVAAGCVDRVLAPPAIAKELARIARHPYVAERLARASASKKAAKSVSPIEPADGAAVGAGGPEDEGYQKILLLLRKHSGVDFSLYKSSTIRRRITRRMVLNRQATLARYADFLGENTAEVAALYADALINVTSFFRNAGAFAALQHKVFLKLLQEPGADAVRVWVLGCAGGQEAYSIAMAFTELADKFPRARKLQVFATDLNEANLAKARHGFYSRTMVQDVSPERLRRFFVEEDGGYRINKPLRELVVFARQNVINDPPFSRLDLISCRNVMIYFESGLQKKLLPAFHYALKPGGCLLLGASESIGGFTGLFAPLDRKQKIFIKKAAPTVGFPLPARSERDDRLPPVDRVARAAREKGTSPRRGPDLVRVELNAEREADRVTVNQFAPPAVLIDADLQILQFRGPTGAFLEPPTGKASFDLLKMAREGLMLPLRAAINRAKQDNRTARVENVPMKQGGTVCGVNLEVVPLKNLKERCFLVLFEETGKGRGAVPASGNGEQSRAVPRSVSRKEESARVTSLECDLAETRDYLQSVQEYQEAANEELQAANEEGQSANEELQSLNEELETSKEELESTNEELTTVNEEMVSRNAELSRLNNDLTNVETSTKFVIVLLGRDLTVRRFSAQAEKQFNLLASDVGRPIGAVRHNLDLPELEAILAEVIAGARESEREVRDHAGHWYSLRVRPYVTVDNKVDGAVLILVDIDALKRTERLITEAHEHAAAIIRTVPDPLVILGADLRIHSTNDAFNRAFQIAPAELEGRSIFEIDHGSWDLPRLRHLLEGIIPGKRVFDDFEVTHDFGRVGRRSLVLNARVLHESAGKPQQILLGIRDITERKRVDYVLAETRELLAKYADNLEKLVVSRTQDLVTANRRLEASVVSVQKGKEEYRALFMASQAMQEKLRHLTREIIATQEEERKAISRELHDEVVQTLVGINVALAALRKEGAGSGPRWEKKIGQTQKLVENSVHAVHRFARGLRPAVLDDLGLIAALHAHCKQLAHRENITIKLSAPRGIEALGAAERTVLYRVGQEALTNVIRHARASMVRIVFRKTAGALRMEIRDNGKSFAVEKTLSKANNKRIGLVGMRERVEMVGGRFTIESTPGIGTTVCAEVPCAPLKPGKK
jgi:two-component system CheB/CheR fusion protein